MNEIYVPLKAAEIEFVEKRSKFIGRIWPIDTEAQALEHLKHMRKQHWDATHNVYAYALNDNNIARYSDDGEPSGTAGLPVLEVLQKNKVTNALCVVTRYFGGILLGGGGLVRAYGTTAKLALDAAGICCMADWQLLALDCEYALLESLRRLVTRVGGTEESVTYAAQVSLQLALPCEQVQAFHLALTELSGGRVTAMPVGVVRRAVGAASHTTYYDKS